MFHWNARLAVLAWVAIGWTSAAIAADSNDPQPVANVNWSRFRGPNGSGIAAAGSFPSQWTQGDYLWRQTLAGVGHSSPVGWGDMIFVTSGDSANAIVTLQALDAATGEQLWSKSFQSVQHSMHASNCYASSSPVVDDQRVYITWATPQGFNVVAVDHQGDDVWQRSLGEFVEKHGFGASPVLIEGFLIIANDNGGESFVAALDPATGDDVWRTPRGSGKTSFATPAVWQSGDASPQIVLDNSADGIVGLSPADGSEIWRVPDANPQRCVLSPLVAGEFVFGGSGAGSNGHSLVCVRPAESAGEQPDVVARLTQSVPQVPTPIAVGDLLFIWHDRGVVSCRNLASGETYWTKRVGGNYYGSPVFAGGKLYCMSREGDAIVLAASDDYQLLGRNSLGEPTHATPTVHRNRMYLRTETTLACLAAETP